MPFIAILIDILAAGAYFLQRFNQETLLLFVGIIFQAIISVILFFLMVTYKGKRYSTLQPRPFVRYFSIRYAIIVFSFILNALVLFLYILNRMGNPVIFS